MNPPKVLDTDYINFLLATQQSYSCLEAERVQPERADGAATPAHDAFNRLPCRLEPDAATLWQEAESHLERQSGLLILDDTTLDKPYATKMDLVTRHWSSKHRAVVDGINLQTLLWSDGERAVPCDYRIYQKAQDGLTKNDHAREMLKTAHARGFTSEYVLFDIWYSGLENLKLVRACGWHFFTQLKASRHVDPDRTGNRPVRACTLSARGTVVHLKGYGLVKVFRIVLRHEDTETGTQTGTANQRPDPGVGSDQSETTIQSWATSDLTITDLTRVRLTENAFAIEHYHRGLKQFCGVEKGQMRLARAQRNHIGLAVRAFLRLEAYCYPRGLSWFEAKARIVWAAVTAYLAYPLYTLSTA